MGKVAALAALLDCTEERSQAVRTFSGIQGSVFLSDDEALDVFARNPASQPTGNIVAFPSAQPHRLGDVSVTTDDVLEYCVSQIQRAQTPNEHRAAVALTWELLKSTGLAEQFKVLTAALNAKDELINS
jgi:acyl homoserine lactone synthase